MARFSANLGFLWSALPLQERIELAAKNGFKAIELHWPYDTSPETVREACKRLGLTLLAANTPLGQPGESGLAALPGREADFQKIFKESMDWCLIAGATAIHVMPGVIDESQRAAATQTMINTLQGYLRRI